MNGIIKNILRKICEEMRLKWNQELHLVLMTTEASANGTIGLFPHETTTGPAVRCVINKCVYTTWMRACSIIVST